MQGVRDNDVLLQAGYDVIMISLLGGFQAIFHDGFWKSDHDYLLVVNGNFCPNSNGLEIIRHFLFLHFSLHFPTGSEILGLMGKMS